MKNIKKLLAVLLAALLCVSVTACANNSSSSTAVATLETSSTASEGETAESTDKDPAGYDDDIQGLCKYLEDCKAAAGEKVQMSYDVIGAENGYKYVYRYADSAVQLEVYEFPAELSETAKALLDAVRADGTFKVLDNTVPGYLSNDGRFRSRKRKTRIKHTRSTFWSASIRLRTQRQNKNFRGRKGMCFSVLSAFLF